MWLRSFKHLVFIVLVLGFAPAAFANDTSTGPTSNAEASILWQDGQTDYLQGKFREAIPLLQRLIDRYPGFPSVSDYHEARLWLGKSYLETGENKKALAEFKNYLEGAIRKINREDALVWSGKAQLNLKQYDEAYMTSVEIQHDAENDPSRKELMAEALLLRARALLGLGGSRQGESAGRVLESADQIAQQSGNPGLRAESAELLLEQKLGDCARLLPHKPLSEGEVSTRFDRRAACLAESFPLYRRAVREGEQANADRANTLLTGAYDGLWKVCQNPPPPKKIKPIDRTDVEKKRYLQELSSELTKNCRRQTDLALDIVRTWTAESPPLSSFAMTHVLALQRELEKFKGN
jgi:tetratricopeptide (TPR) repeat protein